MKEFHSQEDSPHLDGQTGLIHTLPLLSIIAAIGVISFLLISSTLPIGGFFGKLFNKPASFAATDTISVAIDASASNHPISPYIYGTAASQDAYQKTMGTTISRWGGNQVTRFNWEINDSNSGSDWGLCIQPYLNRNYGAFSNVGYTQGAAGLSAKNSVSGNKSLGMDSLFTIPNLGWVAKDGNNNTCSTGVPANDGPSINSLGAISGYDPTANRNLTSIKSQIKKGSAFTQSPSTSDGIVYQDELVNYLVSNFGTAQSGGVKFYAFDNEYDLWASTHRDIHPARVGYDELSSLFNQFSDAVKSVDPTAMVTGPVSWGWTNYWFSPLDAGTDNYGTHADRVAHGNTPLLQWFLRQAKAHETQVGHRTLDVLDVHYYPQGGQALNTDVSAGTAALRLRSVRDLWDPTYTNESWEAGTEGGPQLQVIRKLQSWIDAEYPGTKIGISEWNWGADNDINGGLTIADVLGVFGRENVYSANYWTTPADQSPGYWAWRMYRNYDGAFAHFGDVSVNATTAQTDVDKISVYSSKDSTTGELKIMAINKQPTNDENTTFNLANFNPQGTAKVYSYSQSDTTKINQLASISGIGSSFSANLAPYSITLFVLPSAGSSSATPSISPTITPSSSPISTPSQWINIHPASISLDFNNPVNNYGDNSIVIDTTNHCILMGTNYQGIYKSCDQGTNWTKVDTGTGANMVDGGRIWSLTIDPFNHNTLYAASGYGFGGPLKSTDGGISWIQTLPNTNAIEQQIQTNDIYNVAVDPYTANHILASFHYFWFGNQDSGILESTDGGATWTIHSAPTGSGWGAGNSVWFLNNSQTWLLGSQNAGYWRTTNSGASWSQVSTNNLNHGGIYSLYRSTIPGLLYAAIWNGIMKSTDNGATWQNFSTGLPYAGFETIASDGKNLFTAPSFPDGGDNGQAHGPWFTTAENGGTSWTGYNAQTTCGTSFCNGPVASTYDSTNHIIYTVNWDGGAWKLQTAGSISSTPAPSVCQGADIDKDGKVGVFDYNILVGNFSKVGSGIQGDIDGDGKVGVFDYNILVGNFGKTGC